MTQPKKKHKVGIYGTPQSGTEAFNRILTLFNESTTQEEREDAFKRLAEAGIKGAEAAKELAEVLPKGEWGQIDGIEWISEDRVMNPETWRKMFIGEFDNCPICDHEEKVKKELEEKLVMKNMSPKQKREHRFWHNERDKWRRWRK